MPLIFQTVFCWWFFKAIFNIFKFLKMKGSILIGLFSIFMWKLIRRIDKTAGVTAFPATHHFWTIPKKNMTSLWLSLTVDLSELESFSSVGLRQIDITWRCSDEKLAPFIETLRGYRGKTPSQLRANLLMDRLIYDARETFHRFSGVFRGQCCIAILCRLWRPD